jgi:hypothetical protein
MRQEFCDLRILQHKCLYCQHVGENAGTFLLTWIYVCAICAMRHSVRDEKFLNDCRKKRKREIIKKETLTVPTHCNTVELTLLTVAYCQYKMI